MSDITASIATAIQAKTGGNVEGKLPEWWAEFIGMVLAELQSTGRLIPAGGMALTAEQVEDVRALVWLDGRRNFDAFYRLRALFPATEPAEDAKPCGSNSVTLGWCKLTARHEGLHTNGTYLWGTPSEPDPPAPAEPAEEETKAELPTKVGDRIRASVTRWSSALEWPDSNPYVDTFVLSSSGFWDAENDQFTVVPSCFSYIEVLEALSSPVVPAPTETGPWQRIEDVPADVTVLDCDGLKWSYVDCHWRCHEDVDGPYSLRLINHLAPFVAAEEG